VLGVGPAHDQPQLLMEDAQMTLPIEEGRALLLLRNPSTDSS
jgi:hypothetical protein